MAYDVVVVGGGPAGAVSARFAAEKGARTLIIDKKREIGKPVRCAEVVAGTLPHNFEMKNSSLWLINKTNYFHIISPKGKVVKIKTSPYEGYVLDRVEFERELVRMAVYEGAELSLGKTVTGIVKEGVLVGDEVIKTKIIIAADGVDSRIGRYSGIDTRTKIGMLGSCAQHTLVNIDLNPDSLNFYFGSSFAPGGYAWVFPKGRHEANVGVGILRPRKEGALAVLDKFIKNKFPKGQSIRFVSGCVPSSLPLNESVKGNVVVVGDAARQVNPFTGAGIANAFIAGKIAGELCGEVAVKKQPLMRLREYDRLSKNALERKIKSSFKLRERIIYNDKKVERFCFFLSIMPGFILRRFLKGMHY